MLRPHRITRSIRVLCLATLGVQLGAAAAIAQSALRVSTASEATEVVTAQSAGPAIEVALPVEAPVTTAPATTAPAPVAAPAPAVKPAPAPAAVAVAAPTPRPVVAPTPPVDPATRVQLAYEASVPSEWRNAITVRLELIEGNTSWASHNGTIQIGSAHANGGEAQLRATVAHEFGHLVAFQFGSQAFNGAAPEGWPAYSARPEEAWADCASRAFSGVNDPSHGLPDCAGDSLTWAAQWLGQGPGAHPRTGS